MTTAPYTNAQAENSLTAVSRISRFALPSEKATDAAGPYQQPARSLQATADAQLIQLCQQGDKSAWDTLIHRYEKTIYRFAYTLCSNYDDTMEIAALVFLRVYENLRTFRNASQFSSWLYCIVRNTYVDTCLRPMHRTHISLDAEIEMEDRSLAREIPDSAPSPEEVLVVGERGRLLRKAIYHLPDYQRRMMELYHVQGMSYEEIAQNTGLSIGTVKSRLSRARLMLRERLTGMEELFVAA